MCLPFRMTQDVVFNFDKYVLIKNLPDLFMRRREKKNVKNVFL